MDLEAVVEEGEEVVADRPRVAGRCGLHPIPRFVAKFFHSRVQFTMRSIACQDRQQAVPHLAAAHAKAQDLGIEQAVELKPHPIFQHHPYHTQRGAA